MRDLLLSTGAVLVAVAMSAGAQQVAPKSAAEGKPATKEQAKADAHKLPAERGDVVDRIAAIVNGDLVLESDVDEEMRFTALYPHGVGDDKGTPREQALTRLIDRDLVHQQQQGIPQAPISEEDITKEETDLRAELPACQKVDCKSDAGWKNFLTSMGFTEGELRDRLKQRKQVLQFIEQRFRAGIRITQKQVEDYYQGTMLPEYAKQKTTPPALDTVYDRIEDVLLEQQVSVLLDQWLKTLRDSGHVRVLQPGQEAQ